METITDESPETNEPEAIETNAPIETGETEYTGTATYCPEDDKLRLYVGRVPRAEYEALRAEGWTSTPKQDCDFAAVWTASREDTALRYAGHIDDEDAGPAERAADRAERFQEYQERNLDRATGHADRYDSGPSVHGHQSLARAVRSADKHDRHAGRALNNWDKAEYWQRRTGGVIDHALHLSSPDVRMGRIKTIEADIRRVEKNQAEWINTYRGVKAIAADPAGAIARALDRYEGEADAARCIAANFGHSTEFTHPRDAARRSSFWYLMDPAKPDPITLQEACALWLARYADPERPGRVNRSLDHLRLRLAYENQMLEAQGGRAASVEMIPGGWLKGGRWQSPEWRRVIQVNKSPKTGRVVSVVVRDNRPSSVNHYGNPFPDGIARTLGHTVKVERMDPEAYRAPTDEELAAFLDAKKAAKKAAPKATTIPLINPTEEDAERLQALLNEHALADHCARHLRSYGRDYASEFKPSTVCRITQAKYSACSKGAYSSAETRGICAGGKIEPRASNMYSEQENREKKERGPKVCEVRTTGSNGSDYGARRVIILTDKPAKPLPSAVWEAAPVLAEV